ncbi:phosphatase PAP2 family protein [Halalkalicoccus jeotgali]|uniref:Glucose-6-phosphatase n=1 Tax=Halalkalicoccus jeotgali (strain DSM 18796 / CECT 7217 / JCM 14584 / KCTC 4019 / B3) TaxID=795797 RepID=D8JB99_HALJB|nr:phosphatase PAP2 family protein [Halalkalicoccus jeotgali]ADJ16552.1 glucose-6-phosphatase [Halalkalicoccus jeotgali B3]ELY41352.1 glucose-6-phosphatase [Halalkalicoccus jeotgali B3]
MESAIAELVEFVVWLDHRVVELMLAVRSPLLTEVMTSVTGLGSATAALVFLGICYLAGWTDELRVATLALALAAVVVGTMMWTIQRSFPPDPVCFVSGAQPVTSSLPSGHTAAATIYAMTARRSSVLPVGAVGVLAVAIAVSRIYLGTHYFSDTLVGALIGVGAFALAVSIQDRLDIGAAITRYRNRQ